MRPMSNAVWGLLIRHVKQEYHDFFLSNFTLYYYIFMYEQFLTMTIKQEIYNILEMFQQTPHIEPLSV